MIYNVSLYLTYIVDLFVCYYFINIVYILSFNIETFYSFLYLFNLIFCFFIFFFFSSRRRHTRFSRDWSSDVCSSDLDMFVILYRLFGGFLERKSVLFRRGLRQGERNDAAASGTSGFRASGGDYDKLAMGREVLGRLHDLPEICLELQQDLCVGEIETDHNNSKQLIDTYGTFALLYNWFPEEAQEIRQYTERPRSEFFAIRHSFLREVLRQRWYAYEQTVVMLLQAVFTNKHMSRFFVGNISDLPEGRESFSSALQQVERTERVLKSIWRERNQPRTDWIDEYSIMETQNDQVSLKTMTILTNMYVYSPRDFD